MSQRNRYINNLKGNKWLFRTKLREIDYKNEIIENT